MGKLINRIRIRHYLWLLMTTALLASQSGFAQNVAVTGVVTDASSGETIPGVSILEKGTLNGTTTNIDGLYSINVPVGATLIFSFVGKETQEKLITSDGEMDVTLESSMVELDQIVVVGYGTRKKKDLIGAVSVVETKSFDEYVSANAMQSIQGKVPGMIISSDGSPDGSVDIKIRGINSINANTTPLFVIDGVPTTSNLNELNPQDIESMQVLKDASAASIYGSRASNGVVIITTKKGTAGKTKVNVKTNAGLSFYAKRPSVLDSYQYGQAYWQAAVNDGQDPNQHYLYQYDWHYDADGNPVLDNVLLPKYLDADQTMLTSNTDWYNEISRIGNQKTMDLSFSQGTDRGRSMFSIGLYDNQGIINTSRFSRVNARLNSDYDMFDGRLTIGENLSFSYLKETNTDVLNLTLQTLPVIPVHTVDGIGWGGPVAGMNDRQNPVRLLEDNDQNHSNFMRIFGNAYLDFEIIDDLVFHSSFGIDYGNYYSRLMTYSYQSGYLTNPTNRVNNFQSHTFKYTFTNTLNYKLQVGKHDWDFLAGTEMFSDSYEEFGAGVEDFELEDPDYMYINAGTGAKSVLGSGTGYRLLSYFGKANYTFNNKYLASVTMRYDGSSRFGANNQFGLFPAASAGWRISEEDFFKESVDIMSDFKLRAGWGQTGNQAIDNLARYSIFISDYDGGDPTWASPWGTAYDIGGYNTSGLPSGYRRVRLGNDDLKWETTTQTNIGIDYGFKNQQLRGSIDYFWKKTEDMLFEPGYIGVIGEGGNQWVNGAAMTNHGLEFLISWNEMVSEDFDYSITGNLSSYVNEIVDLPEAVENAYGGNGRGDNILGHPLGSFYGYVADGLYRTEDEVANSPESVGKGLGRIRFKDLNGDGVITDDDRTWIGIPHPDFTYGLNFSVNYKGFDFNMFWEGVVGIDVINQAKYHTDFWSVKESGSNKGDRLLGAWSPTNTGSDIPALTLIDANNENRFSTYVVESGSYLKLRYLQVGYTFDLPKSGIDKLRVYLGGQNLVTIKSKSFTGIDPETPNWGYPIPVTLTAGVNLTF
ncbi:MAG: TonB-dependent receptor [Clostridia bacterium]|nr:TonB-dependent receptor [Clostridia bacterium]